MKRINHVGFGSLLRSARKSANITQADLAVRAGLDVETISKWEREVRSPNGYSIARVSKAFAAYGVDFDRQIAEFLATSPPIREEVNGLKRRFGIAAKAASLAVDEVAIQIGVPIGTLRTWLDRGQVSLRSQLEAIALTLDVAPAYLEFGPDQPLRNLSSNYFSVMWIPEEINSSVSVPESEFIEFSDDLSRSFFDLSEGFQTHLFLENLPILAISNGGRSAAIARLHNVHKSSRVVRASVAVGRLLRGRREHWRRIVMEGWVAADKQLYPSWGVRHGNLADLIASGEDAVGVEKSEGGDLREGSVDDDAVALTQRPSAYQFGVRDGRIFAEPLGGASPSSAGSDLRLELLEKARDLLAKLAKTQAPTHISDTVARLVEALADTFEDIRPGILLSRARSVEAAIAVFDTPEARNELFTDTQSLLRDVGASLADLMSLFPEILAIESNRLALQITSERSAEILSASIEITGIARASSIVDDSAVVALEMTALDIEETDRLVIEAGNDAVRAAAWEARGRLVAQRLLDVRNFAASAVNAARRQSGRYASEAAVVVRKASLEGLEGAVKEVSKGAVKGSIVYLVYQMLGPIAALSMLVGSFAPLSRKAKELTDDIKKD